MTVMNTFTNALAEETGIDAATADKIVTWLATEGFVDTAMVTEIYAPVTGEYSANDNATTVAA